MSRDTQYNGWWEAEINSETGFVPEDNLEQTAARKTFLESLIKMLESSADSVSESDDADLKSFLDSKKEVYGEDGLREIIKEQLADVESEILFEELMTESIDDMSKESYELLLKSIEMMNENQLVSYINQYWFELL